MFAITSILTFFGWLIFIFLSLSFLNNKYNKLLELNGWIFTAIFSFIFSYYSFIKQQSIIQGSLSVITGLFVILIIYLILFKNLRIKQTKIFITVSSGILLFAYTISFVQSALIYNVAAETQYLLQIIGYDIILENGRDGIYIVFLETELRTEIVLACTSVGSIALFTGFISAINSINYTTKLLYIILSSVTIYILNLIRNVFIAGAYGGQWFHIQPEIIGYIFGRNDEWVSFYIADRIISQIGAVIVMIIFAIGVIKIIDEETKLIDEWVYVIDEINKII